MSRTGNKVISIPSGVEFKFEDGTVTVKGTKGTLTRKFNNVENIKVETEEGTIKVSRENNLKQTRMMHGTIRSHINNMIEGVNAGYKKELEIQGIGYRAQMQGDKLVLSLGFSHPVEYISMDGVKLEAPSQTSIIIEGIDKEKVGQVAAEIRSIRPPEPYKGKGVRYKDEIIVLKEGKKA
jgi:large subunit ribosomal protein L6